MENGWETIVAKRLTFLNPILIPEIHRIVNFGTDRRLHFQNLVVFIFLSYCVLYFCSRIVVASLKEWGVEVDDAFFLGGIDKSRILNIMKPHIFFDDQMTHLDHIDNVPAVHIPFGIANKYVGYD